MAVNPLVARTLTATSVLLAVAAITAAGCAGILGLDETSLDKTGPDGATGMMQEPPSDASSPVEEQPAVADAPSIPTEAAPVTDTGTPPAPSEAGSVDAGPAPEAGPSGTVDTSFQGGFALDSTDPANSIFNAVAIDASNRLVAGGSSGSGGWLVRRFADDGAPDTTFNAAIGPLLPTTGALNDLTIDLASGEIICTGTTGATGQLTVVVFDGNGHVAGGFNGGTALTLNTVVAPNGSTGNAVTMIAGGSFFVAGSSTNGSTVALLSNSIGETTTPSVQGFSAYGGPSGTAFHALAPDPTGGLVAAGSMSNAGGNAFVARFGPAGALDSAFGDAGGTRVGDSNCPASAVAVAPHSGSIVTAGTNPVSGNLVGCYAMWTASGAPGWALSGTAGGGSPFTYTGLANARDAQDRMYMVGYGTDMYSRAAELDRILSTDGAFDVGFGPAATGKVILGDQSATPPAFYYVLKGVAVDASGRIVIAGSKKDGSGVHAVLGRFWP